ncbi:AMP-binding protein [Roseomonas marmotae]|uniref:AMP-binding protein n=1 Tax=Roseomonas marmotae TaxID=2768161 RepID=A0ABS3KA12_9PROT|nr:AMP-binding protein [Roseomonas marmotae]MBO1073176.1 AMP-binding protein [Roseomonas marmotae]QTI79190.1 AMP-binding protein [Roseomonas marmotae]
MSADTLPGLLERLAAERPEAAALVSLSRPPLSRAAFAAQARRVAEGLARQGIGPGDRVALLLPNRPEFMVLLLALARLGATAVPLDPRCGVEDLATLLSRARAAAVAVSWDGGGQLPKRLSAGLELARAPLRCVIGLDAGGTATLAGLPVLPWKSLDAMPEREAVEATPEAVCLALPAGEARLALHRQGSVTGHGRAVATALGLDEASAVLPALSLASPDALAAALAALSAGARLLCQEEAGATATDSLARAHGATHLLAGPADLAALGGMVARRPYAALTFAGAAGPVEAPGLPLREIWGSAETQGLFALREEAGFRPVHPASLRLEGEALAIRAPSLLAGYCGGGEALTADGFLDTGLPAALAGESFQLTGPRADGAFRRDGMVVSPAAVARFLARQPGVEEALAVGTPAGLLVAFIRPVADAPAEEGILLAACREALAAPCCPDRIVMVEQLPEAPAEAAAALALMPAAEA